ncbi:phosphatidylinositide phosphatase SAC2-like [Anguilla rostrata]|uniref:phosphatidylinositide phosphatase SAC2-like n=1 Tax=Anguilla rostrata TaxID=7938 RepID=UPI0030CB323F
MDCLDRTNVVQAAIARTVMEQQLKKLGVMPPEQPLPLRCYRIYQVMWANNGDTISRQYAGTAALKGDFTRTGERRLAGVMKDGVNSANRYYLNRFRDAYRQAVIDLMMGLPVTEDLYSIFSKEKEQEEKEKEQEEKEQAGQRAQQEQVSLLLQTYMQMLLPEEEKFHGGWALIDCDPSLIDATHKDVDVLLLLSNSAYYVAYYDDEADKVSQYQRIGLEDLEKIEIGPEPTLFGKPKFCCMRVHHKKEEMSGYFHTLRAVTRHPEDDGKDTLQCIAEILRISKQALGLELVVTEKKLERKHSRPHDDIMGIREKNQDQVLGSTGLAQGKNFLMNKFSSLNQKVKQTKSNVNIGNFKPLGKLGNISKTDVTANFLKPNMKVALWKSDSSLETLENNPGGGAHKGHSDASDLEISSDSDSCHSDDRPHSASLENVDYVLPSCGIVASAPRLGARSQSIGGVEIVVPSIIRITNCEGKTEGRDEAEEEEEEGRNRGPKGHGDASKGQGEVPKGQSKAPEGRGKSPDGRGKSPDRRGKSPEGRGEAPEGRNKGPKGQGEAPEGRDKGSKGQAAEAAMEEDAKLSFGTPIDAYCLQFAQDAKSKCAGAPEAPAPAAPPQQDARAPGSAVAPASAESQPPPPPPGEQQLPRPAQLDVSADLLSVQPPGSAASASSQRSLGAPPEGSAEPSPADGSRTVSPFAKIRSSMVQVASLTQAGLSQGISFAVAKVQKSPEPEAVNETQQNQLKAMFTQCQTRIIQI